MVWSASAANSETVPLKEELVGETGVWSPVFVVYVETVPLMEDLLKSVGLVETTAGVLSLLCKVETVPLMEDLLKSVGNEKDDVTVAGPETHDDETVAGPEKDDVGCVRVEEEDLEELGRPCQ